MSSMESVAARSARLQAEISNKQLAAWLAKNEQKLLAQPELQPKEATPISRAKAQPEPLRPLPDRPPIAQAPDKPGLMEVSRREYLNKKFARTGNLAQDINIRGN